MSLSQVLLLILFTRKDCLFSHKSFRIAIYQNVRSQKHKIITTIYIITELVALLASPLRIPKAKAIAFIQSLKTSPYVEVIHVFYCDNLGVEDLIKQI